MNQYITDFVITISKKHIALSINPGVLLQESRCCCARLGGGGTLSKGPVRPYAILSHLRDINPVASPPCTSIAAPPVAYLTIFPDKKKRTRMLH